MAPSFCKNSEAVTGAVLNLTEPQLSQAFNFFCTGVPAFQISAFKWGF